MTSIETFQKVVFIGKSIGEFVECTNFLSGMKNPPQIAIIEYTPGDVIETELQKFALRNGFGYFAGCSGTKPLLAEKLTQEQRRTLILSMGNQYVFPEEVCRNKNLSIVNFHNSLLPKHPGAYAERHTIWHGDKEGGVTLHDVDNEGIDNGAIIDQAKISIPLAYTWYELRQAYDNLSVQLFKKNIKPLLDKTAPRQENPISPDTKTYAPFDLPPCDFNNPNQTARFLKAFYIDRNAPPWLQRVAPFKLNGDMITFMDGSTQTIALSPACEKP